MAAKQPSGLHRVYDVSDASLMHIILVDHLPPLDPSPYFLRRVCRRFRGFYDDSRSIWIRLLQLHFREAAAALLRINPDITLEEARRLCNLALQESCQEWLKGPVLYNFRASGYSTLDLSCLLYTSPSPRD